MNQFPAWFEIERYQEAVAMEESFCDACGENPCECEYCDFCDELVDNCECCGGCGDYECDVCSELAEANEVEAEIDRMEEENG